MEYKTTLNRKDRTIIHVYEDGSEKFVGRYYTTDDFHVQNGLINYEVVNEAYGIWEKTHLEMIKVLGKEWKPKSLPSIAGIYVPYLPKSGKTLKRRCVVADFFFTLNSCVNAVGFLRDKGIECYYYTRN